MEKIIPKSELGQHYHDDDVRELAPIRERLNECLKWHRGSKFTIEANLLGNSQRIRHMIEEELRGAGYKVELQSDQREGDFYWIE